MTDEKIDSSDLTFEQKVQALWDVITYWPSMIVTVTLLNLSMAFLEGIGISFILPIIELVEAGEAGIEAEEGLMYWFISAYKFIGVPLTLGTVILGIIGVMFLRFSSTFLAKYTADILSYNYKTHLQEVTYSKALNAKITYFDHQGSDEILNTIITEAKRSQALIRFILRYLRLIFLTIIYLTITIYISPILILLTVAIFGVISFLFNVSLEPSEDIGERMANANEQIQRIAQAGIQGIRDVKSFNCKEDFKSDFKKAVLHFLNNKLRLSRNRYFINTSYNFLTIVAMFGLVYIALNWTPLSTSSLGVFLVSLFRLAPKVSNLNSNWYNILGNLPHLIRAQQFIRELEPLNSEYRNQKLSGSVKKIQFENVSFSYVKEKVLSNISFVVKDNQTVAFVGSTGAGKSTIAELLTGFYPQYRGKIVINGIKLSELDLENWWSKLAVVRQDPHIFNESLRNNLLIANKSSTSEDINQVVKVAEIDEFLGDLDNGLDTLLGDQGVRLSGGQRQRVALARALLKDSRLLILDEATSALDYETEEKLYRNLEDFTVNKNVIVIAHRLSTIKNADKIYYLSNGRIKESGSHQELMKNHGSYQSLYKTNV